MVVDLSKLPIRVPKRDRAIEPIEIFRSLTLRGKIENIHDPQGEALKTWHAKRDNQDVIIEMNTGGGKTLVGLLIAQSIVNETRGKVLYICPTNQLVEQTAAHAKDCGIDVAVYMGGNWINGTVFDACTGPCITNYAAVFNGKTIFRDYNIRGIIFDDAHVAHNAIRSQFRLNIHSDHPAFRHIANLFRNHFARNSQNQQFDEALDSNWMALLFVPMFEVRRHSDNIRRILLENSVEEAIETKFAWKHLKDRLSRCAVILSGSGIEITPPLLPLHTLPYFTDEIRRIYLTATLPSQVEFLRTFGIASIDPITPVGKLGEAQRQFLFLCGDTDEEQQRLALELIEDKKACIITPSYRTGDNWCPPAKKFEGRHSAIKTFAESKEAEKLALIARYDGIDLPGDACRILILDGIPIGASLLDRFIDQSLRIEKLRLSHMATRIVQAIGRIFRSNTDHGAVLISGVELQRWLRDPNHQQFMPTLLQQQVQLGIELRCMVDEGLTNFSGLLNAVLKGQKDWDRLYSAHVRAFETGKRPQELGWFTEYINREREAFRKLWNGNYPAAASEYNSLANDATENDKRLGAWYRHWEGLSYDFAGEVIHATRAYIIAANERAELGRPQVEKGLIKSSVRVDPSLQARSIATIFNKNKGKVVRQIKQIRKRLTYGPETNPVEQSLCELGTLLGLEASRPDRKLGTGPDVLWRYPKHKAGVALEAKTNKEPESQFRKTEIGQFHDHIIWLENTYKEENFVKAIVGRRLKVSKDSNPPEDLKVIVLEQFVSLSQRLMELFEFVESVMPEEDMVISMERGLRELGLGWPQCIESLESILAIDLKNEEFISDDLE